MVQPSRALKLPPLHSQNPMVLLHSQRRRFTNLCSALASLLKWVCHCVSWVVNSQPSHLNNGIAHGTSTRKLTTFCCCFFYRDPFPASKNIPVDQLLEIIARLLALNSKTLSKAARANFGTIFVLKPPLVASLLFPFRFKYRATHSGFYYAWFALGLHRPTNGSNWNLQGSTTDQSRSSDEPFCSSAPMDVYSIRSTSSSRRTPLRVYF